MIRPSFSSPSIADCATMRIRSCSLQPRWTVFDYPISLRCPSFKPAHLPQHVYERGKHQRTPTLPMHTFVSSRRDRWKGAHTHTHAHAKRKPRLRWRGRHKRRHACLLCCCVTLSLVSLLFCVPSCVCVRAGSVGVLNNVKARLCHLCCPWHDATRFRFPCSLSFLLITALKPSVRACHFFASYFHVRSPSSPSSTSSPRARDFLLFFT